MKKTFCNSIIRLFDYSIISRTRQGSALLIVLGMAAFMMVSAVSFAIYMRESRVPSSQLRRQIAARYLMKAALANAINRIDGHGALERMVWDDKNNKDSSSLLIEGVYDDPYPGVGPNTNVKIEGLSRDQLHIAGNHWVDRVFTPFSSVSPEETVPVLTLEALAYLPPAIINEVRLASRKTRTAKWANLSYELGRYAFCAVNVSDCFDLNRLSAGNRRTSAAGQRINMSTLFRNGGLSDLNAGYANQLDSILDRAGDIPFVSLADFNLVAGKSPFSPFCSYIGGGSTIYEQGDAPALSNALFTVDTWFPPTNRVNTAVKRYNLAAQQPFNQIVPDKGLMAVVTGQNQFYTDLQKHIGVIGMCCLYDYLDSDHRPLSFCIPSTETVPMVVGLGLLHNGQIAPASDIVETREGKYKDDVPATDTTPKISYVRRARRYAVKKLRGSGPVHLTGLVSYPFLRTKDKGYDSSFTGEALVSFWWGPESIDSRLAEDCLIHPTGKVDWDMNSNRIKDGLITAKVMIQNLDLKVVDNPKDETETLGKFNEQIDNMPTDVDLALFWHVEEFEQREGAAEKRLDEYYSFDGVNKSPFVPRDKDGKVESWWDTRVKAAAAEFPTVADGRFSGDPQSKVKPGEMNTTPYVLHVTADMIIKDKENKIVDVVPARLSDDEELGAGAISLPDDFFGGGSPILEFRGDRTIAFSKESAEAYKEGAEEFKRWDRLYCVDPRFNWAPEHWFAMSGGQGVASKEDWIAKVNGLLGGNDRDHDIFLFTSDQEYLQSIGELMFLPYLGWGNGGGFETYRSEFTGEFDGSSFANRVNVSGNVGTCRNMFWTSYGADEIYGFDGEMEVVSGLGDFRVNPFSDDVRVLMAALANTPYDYYVASTNENSAVNKFANADLNESLKHAFNEKTAVAKMEDDVLWDLADAMHNRFRAKATSGSSDWASAFDNLGWYDGQKGDDQLSLFGVELEDGHPLYGVDRKFLYSYWRECFQNRQQLFLVFLRAEPLTVGGSSGAALESAQLGARGVALVWRDPAKPSGTRVSRESSGTSDSWYSGGKGVAPHRTRVLFYHQFE